MTGGADFLEGIFFTTLIAYCLRFGQSASLEVLGTPADDEYMKCTKGISEWCVQTHGKLEHHNCLCFLIVDICTGGSCYLSHLERWPGAVCSIHTTLIFPLWLLMVYLDTLYRGNSTQLQQLRK